MARIRPYEQQTSVSGVQDIRRASSEDFGFGGAMQNFGETLQRVGLDMKQQQENRILDDAQEAMSRAKLDMLDRFNQRQQAHQPGDMTFAEQTREEMDSYFTDMSLQYGNENARKYVRQRGAELTASFFGQSLNFQAQQGAAYSRNMIEVRKNNDRDLVSKAPQMYDLTKRQGIEDIRNRTGDLAWLNPADLARYEQQYVGEMAWASVMGSLNNPSVRGVAAGAIDAAKVISIDGIAAKIPNMGADFVKPYDQKTIGSRVELINKPSQYDDLFKQAGQKYGIDWRELKLRAAVESSLNAEAVGPLTKEGRQSFGLMQFEKSTAAGLGIDPMNPAQAIDAAAAMMAPFKGDTRRMDMEYYGGANQKQWGPNTNQYAENLAALRVAAGLVPMAGIPLDQIDEAAMPPGYQDLTPERRLQYLREVESINRRENTIADKARQQTMRDHQAEMVMNGGVVRNPLPESAFTDPVEWQKYSLMLQAGAKAHAIANSKPADQLAMLEQMKPTQTDGEAPGMFAYRKELYDNAVNIVIEGNKRKAKDSMGYAMQSGFFRDAPASQITTADPAQLVEQIKVRGPQADAVSETFGTEWRLFTEPEAKFQKQSFDRMTTDQQIDYVEQLQTALSKDRFRQTIKQIAGADYALMASAVVASSDGPNKQQDAEFIMLGRNIMAYDPEGKRKQAQGLPDKKMAYEMIAEEVADVVGVSEVAKDAFVDSVVAHYIGKMTKTNSFANLDLKERSNAKEFRKSVQTLMPTAQVGAYNVIAPYGMDEDAFLDRLDTNVQSKFNGKYRSGEYSVLNVPGEMYQLVVGGVPQGTPFVLEEIASVAGGATLGGRNIPSQFAGRQTFQQRTGRGFYEDASSRLYQGMFSGLQGVTEGYGQLGVQE